jgi:protein-S-isoprenylcysteine O-methyltransferase Ste14
MGDPRAGHVPSLSVGRVAYALAFTLVLPALLVAWGLGLDSRVTLPMPLSPIIGHVISTLGAALTIWAVWALHHFGQGLPMSAYPPERYVHQGPYRFLPHPIYVGFVLLAAGTFVGLDSPAGLWIVVPVLVGVIATWVIGFERDATLRRFAGELESPLLALPRGGFDRPTAAERWSVYLLVFLPWGLVYEALEQLGPPPDAVSGYLAFESNLPVVGWMEGLYVLTYPFVLAAPLLAMRRCDLRRFALRGLIATAVCTFLYLVLPIAVVAKPPASAEPWHSLMRFDRWDDSPATAFPAFHLVWTGIAAALYAARWPRLRWAWWLFTAAVGVSCVGVGMHAIADVLAGALVLFLVLHTGDVWELLRRGAELVANSWREVTLGPVRLLSHGIYAAIAAVACLLGSAWLAGPATAYGVMLAGVLAVVGAALWAQLLEGSPQLLRPYGYFGGVLGFLLGAALAPLVGARPWHVIAAMAVTGPLLQAIGRMRCLVQGCCHGRLASDWVGIRCVHPRSRVTRLARLAGVPIHPTPLYSILANLVIGGLLLRLWCLGAPTALVAGGYFLLTGIARFAEEHFRGEPQTAVLGGLHIYQWLALAFIAGGAAVTLLPSLPVPPPGRIDPAIAGWSLLYALVVFAAYGLDFPRSNRRFSRLV